MRILICLVLLATGCISDLGGCSSGLTCSGVATSNPCPGGTCPQNFTDDETVWCRDSVSRSLLFLTECSGFDIVRIGAIDSGSVVYYKDGSYVGYATWSGGETHFEQSCVSGVPSDVTLLDCPQDGPTIQCPSR